MADMWNNVDVIGPTAEIDRFKRLCIDPPRSIYTSFQSGWTGCDCTIVIPAAVNGSSDPEDDTEWGYYVHNFQQFTTESPNEYSFSFDTYGQFPEHVFDDLAARFPALAFDCYCIQAADDCMGYGWFNPPPGGEAFRQDYAVPKNYWSSGCYKRSSVAQTAHEARIDALLAAARRCDAALITG